MANMDIARSIALSLPGAEEHDHFGRPSFRVKGKIFATLWPKERRAVVMLSPIDQSVFQAFNADIFYAVPNKWGLKGATFIELDKVRTDILEDAITLAWRKLVGLVE